jgi:hypothetical protein
MIDPEFTKAVKAAKWMIDGAETKLKQAITDKKWNRVSQLSDYMDGMTQILTVFEVAQERMEKDNTLVIAEAALINARPLVESTVGAFFIEAEGALAEVDKAIQMLEKRLAETGTKSVKVHEEAGGA